jgi:hypothetical protein
MWAAVAARGGAIRRNPRGGRPPQIPARGSTGDVHRASAKADAAQPVAEEIPPSTIGMPVPGLVRPCYDWGMTNGQAKEILRAILTAAAGAINTNVSVSDLSAKGLLPADFRECFNLLNKRGFIRYGLGDVHVTDAGAKFIG